jgi:glycosyltransferase involved in cell wall biosynthesis
MENKIVVCHFINQLSKAGGAEEVLRVIQKFMKDKEVINYYLTLEDGMMGNEIRLEDGNVICGSMEDNIKFCGILQPDIIMLHTAGYIPTETTPIVNACPKAKKCFIIHSPQPIQGNPYELGIDLLVCVTNTVYNLQPYPNKITIENGVDIEKIKRIDQDKDLMKELGILETDIVIGKHSRIAPDKMVEDFILIANRIANKVSNVKFLVVGDSNKKLNPGYIEKLKELSTSLCMNDKIIWVGEQRNLSKYLSLMDISLAVTSNESFGMVFAEAMLAKLPVVTYDNWGNNQTVINDYNGFLVPFRNLNEAAEKTIELCINKKKRELLSKNAYQYATETKSGKVMSENYYKLYKKLMEG